MLETVQNIFFIGLVIIGPFFLIWLLERRIKKKGPLFSGPATRIQRIIALLLGLAFATAFLWELFNSPRINLLWPILAVALIGYGLGARRLLDQFQGNSSVGKSVNVRAYRDRKIFTIPAAILLGGVFLLGWGALSGSTLLIGIGLLTILGAYLVAEEKI